MLRPTWPDGAPNSAPGSGLFGNGLKLYPRLGKDRPGALDALAPALHEALGAEGDDPPHGPVGQDMNRAAMTARMRDEEVDRLESAVRQSIHLGVHDVFKLPGPVFKPVVVLQTGREPVEADRNQVVGAADDNGSYLRRRIERPLSDVLGQAEEALIPFRQVQFILLFGALVHFPITS